MIYWYMAGEGFQRHSGSLSIFHFSEHGFEIYRLVAPTLAPANEIC
jgi:hypothetical protein